MARAQLHGKVHVLRGGVSPFHQKDGLDEIRHQQAIHYEPRRVATLHANLADPLDPFHTFVEHRVVRVIGPDDLHELHQLYRVEEVHPYELFGTPRRQCHLRYGEGGRVGREDRFRLALLPKVRVELFLQVHVFDDGLHDKIRIVQRVPVGGEGDFVHQGVSLLRAELSFGYQLLDRFLDAIPAAIKEGRFRLVGDDGGVDAVLGGGRGGGLGYAVAHEAEADDSEFVEVVDGGSGGDSTAAELEQSFGTVTGGPSRQG
mmetsp:Transcript_14603/g.31768  ORF Transcript_14603/g.31768 Transcript_14603/m.31768 type:complete len:259 (-) Transcript_14603:59-835(-)|eukprot:CAMPEP_0172527458 /NCGR_PEP_ID=MMETSP1067-20121228/2135_1 /TAXON_ID=265564 ORGANISM="Thalassiosira punctigera, Strain Tpunct2005C2" /NCGR_SAMPLE_ID=MMETSP1067 /ASSEMBLY_ACC=CAM_ASM_000444 /LENGTH=258 /DNA_ID=CAMNT_0013311201 /DNA_START=546 /DNA_END=1322 /DNA_ORIENTATION=-